MKLTIGDYKIESDSNCFSLLAKKIVQPIVKDGLLLVTIAKLIVYLTQYQGKCY